MGLAKEGGWLLPVRAMCSLQAKHGQCRRDKRRDLDVQMLARLADTRLAQMGTQVRKRDTDPSMYVSSTDSTFRVSSCIWLCRAGAIESISSMKTTTG